MMNRSSPDPYHIPSIMSYANLEPTITNNNINTTQKSHFWDFDTQPNFTHTQTYPYPPCNFDPQPPFALPINPNFPFFPSPVQVIADYNPAGVVKRELEGGPGMMSIGLNLGHRTYFSSDDALTVDRLLAARAHHQMPPRCQVEGCRADLAGAKHYHRRHKVCEFHSKAGVVLAGGMQQRFCQQCSRFHVLAEFDASKRSCRKRLADHNRRRRKPQPQSQSTTNSTDKTKHTTPRPNSINTTNKYTRMTTTAPTTTTSSGLLEEGNQGNQSREMLFRKGPALSLGEFEGGPQIKVYDYQKLLPHSNNSDTSSFYHHHNQALFGSSSNEASQSTNGQAIFEVDFI